MNKWHKLSCVTDEIIELLNSFFKYEHERITLSELKTNKWIHHKCSKKIDKITDEQIYELAVAMNKSLRKLGMKSLTKNTLLLLIKNNIMNKQLLSKCNCYQFNLENVCNEYFVGLLSNGYLIEYGNNSDYMIYHLDQEQILSR